MFVYSSKSISSPSEQFLMMKYTYAIVFAILETCQIVSFRHRINAFFYPAYISSIDSKCVPRSGLSHRAKSGEYGMVTKNE